MAPRTGSEDRAAGAAIALSVVIPCFNNAAFLPAQLEALRTQRWHEPWEIILADNGSTDDSVAIAMTFKDRLPTLRIVDASGRRGAAHARNVGVREAAGDALAFCDADDEVGDGWVAAMGEALSKHDFVASRHDFTKLNSPSIQRTRRNQQGEGLQTYTYPPYLPHAGGCGLGIKRALHELVGGFDETMHRLQDTDYCWRVQLAGTRLHYAADAVIHVRFRDTMGGIYRQAVQFGEYNVLLYKKYRPLGMPELSWRQGARAWYRLLVRLPHLRNRRSRLRWVRSFGWRFGRLRGSIKYRVLVL